jgi:hypothetical protein
MEVHLTPAADIRFSGATSWAAAREDEAMSNTKIQLRLPEDMKAAATRQAALSGISLKSVHRDSGCRAHRCPSRGGTVFRRAGRAHNAGPREGAADLAWNTGGGAG